MAKQRRRQSRTERDSSLVTPKFTAMFAQQLLKPRGIGNSEPFFSVMMALEKDHKWWKTLKKALDDCLLAKFDKTSKDLKIRDWPIKNGDKMDLSELRGKYVIRPKTYDRPGFLDIEGDEIESPTSQEIYSGMICRVSIRPWAWYYQDTNSRGVSIFLNNVLKVEDGERISGRPSAADDFSQFLEEDEAGGNPDDEGDAYEDAGEFEDEDEDEIPF